MRLISSLRLPACRTGSRCGPCCTSLLARDVLARDNSPPGPYTGYMQSSAAAAAASWVPFVATVVSACQPGISWYERVVRVCVGLATTLAAYIGAAGVLVFWGLGLGPKKKPKPKTKSKPALLVCEVALALCCCWPAV